MSASPQDMQSLLGGLLNVQGQPQVNSGLLGAGDQAAAPYGGLTQLGLSLLANSNSGGHFGQIVGQSALQSQQLQQQRQMQQIQIAQGMMSLGLNAQKQRAIMDMLNGQNGQNRQTGGPTQQNIPAEAQAAIPPSAPPPMLQAGGGGYNPSDPSTSAQAQGLLQVPQASSQQQSQSPQFAASQIDQIPINGVSPDLIRRFDLINGKDPIVTNKEIREQQLQIYQQSVKPQIDALDNVIKSDKPTQYVAANPQLMRQWQEIAPTLGMDPRTGFTDQNVRTALNFKRNQIAAPAQLGTEAPIVPLQNKTLPDGRVAQVDPISGKVSIEAPSPLEKVVGNDGKALYVPSAKAAGMRPFSEMNAASDEALQSAAEQVAGYKIAPPTGSKLLSGNWPQVMKLVQQINPAYDATAYATKNKARMAFATGKQGDITRSLSVANDHLDQLSQAVTELKNGGIPAANKVANFFSQQTGNPSVTNFDAMKEIVGDEVVKAVVGSTGAAGDREAIKKTFSDASSPAQLTGVITKYKGLMNGQLNGLRRQYESKTGLKDFDEAISSSAENELGSAASGGGSGPHPPAIQSLLDKYK